MSFPDFIPSFTIKQDMDELALSLALSVLSMSKSEFNSMSIQDIKQYYSTFNQDHRLAYEILLCYKSRHDNHIRYNYHLPTDPNMYEFDKNINNKFPNPWIDPRKKYNLDIDEF